MRKQIFISSLLVLIVGAISCQRAYEPDLLLAVSRNDIKVGFEKGQDYFKIYSTKKWKIDVPEQAEWLSLSTLEGFGNRQIDLFFEENPGLSRFADITITAEEDTVHVLFAQQKGYTEDATYTLERNNILLLGSGTEISIPVRTNVPDDNLSLAENEIIYQDGTKPWIKDFAVGRDKVTFSVSENGTGSLRSAVIIITFPVPYWDTPVTATLELSQGTDLPAFASKNILIDASTDGTEPLSVALGLNFTPAYYDFPIKVTYTPAASWIIDGIVGGDGIFHADLLPNMTESQRETVASISVEDGSGYVFDTCNLTIRQKRAVLDNIPGTHDGEEPVDVETDF